MKASEADVFPQTRAADPDGGISGMEKKCRTGIPFIRKCMADSISDRWM